MSSMQTKCL